jgi:hypothetical protein
VRRARCVSFCADGRAQATPTTRSPRRPTSRNSFKIVGLSTDVGTLQVVNVANDPRINGQAYKELEFIRITT